MADATISHLTPRAVTATAPRDRGPARVIELPARATGRVIRPLDDRPSSPAAGVGTSAHQHGYDPGPLARALMTMAATER